MIKQLTGWKPQRLIDLVLKLKENVSVQLKEIRSTLHDNGNFELVGPAKRRLLHSAANWANLGKEARNRLFQKLLVYRPPSQPTHITSTDGRLTIPAPKRVERKPGQRKRTACERTNSAPKSKRLKPAS